MQEYFFLKSFNPTITERQYQSYQKFKYFCNLEDYYYIFVRSDNLIMVPYYYEYDPYRFIWKRGDISSHVDLKFIFHVITKDSQFFLQNGFVFFVRDKLNPVTYFEWSYDLTDIFYLPELIDDEIVLKTFTSGKWVKKKANDFYSQNILNLGILSFQPKQTILNPKKDFNNFDTPDYFWVYYDERLTQKYFYRRKYYYLPSDSIVLENFDFFDFVGWSVVDDKVVRTELIEIIESLKSKTVKEYFDLAVKTDFSTIYFWSTNFELDLYQNHPLVFLNSEYLNGCWVNVR